MCVCKDVKITIKKKDISLVFCLFLTSVVLASMASYANLHKRRETLARCYVTSHWQAEWVNKLNWKTIETPPPSWYLELPYNFKKERRQLPILP